jgi:AraC family transcriptional regulator, regulatory protein of adaptative response / methylated-DNA-[protein]-cysteine methyltransferase
MNDDTRWSSLCARDRAADGRFWYGVMTTGVYCKPSCAARPLRRNVRFFDSIAAARAANLRACKRCKPDAAVRDADAELQYAVANTALGVLLVVASARGIRRAVFIANEMDLLDALAQCGDVRATAAPPDDARFTAWFAQFAARLAGDNDTATPPLDPQGSAFQQRVWVQLRRIACGRVASYAEVARALQRPTATRAVAQACAANPIGVLIPCHRVVRSDGGIGGYRWGVARKRALLATERNRAAFQSPHANTTTATVDIAFGADAQ